MPEMRRVEKSTGINVSRHGGWIELVHLADPNGWTDVQADGGNVPHCWPLHKGFEAQFCRPFTIRCSPQEHDQKGTRRAWNEHGKGDAPARGAD